MSVPKEKCFVCIGMLAARTTESAIVSTLALAMVCGLTRVIVSMCEEHTNNFAEKAGVGLLDVE
jgi:Na+-transporting NADH:ubiquinone oxidoreductase subunit NqrD